jgi:acetylornithine/succinyldiaminopimelate/putrescine aminotransferase
MLQDFLQYQAQTSNHPMGLEISHATGSYIYDKQGKAYLDFVAGVSANTLGHTPQVVQNAVIKQMQQYTHVMVYGEFAQEKPIALAQLLTKLLPEPLDMVYLTNSGTEATEGALKLAKRVTGRSEIISAHLAYHGNTMGAMSVAGKESTKAAFRPLVPGTKFIHFNQWEDINLITEHTAAVILETIQGSAGFKVPQKGYLQAVKDRCDEMGALLILDEIQSGMGRTGQVFEFMNHEVVPDILITGKGLGGGMPIGAFIASREHMIKLAENPKLGHITTFGGHPVIAAAGEATLKEVINSGLMDDIEKKEMRIRQKLQHPSIQEIRGKGLMLAAMVETPELATKIILKALDKKLILFWLLFEGKAIRITPPLNISIEEIDKGCEVLLKSIDEVLNENKV